MTAAVATSPVTTIDLASETLVARILRETPIGMAVVARRLGRFRDDKPTHPRTPTRWARDGVLLADGTRLHLEAVILSGRLVTSWPAVERFIEAQQQPVSGPAAPPVRSPGQRTLASEAAERELIAAGA